MLGALVVALALLVLLLVLGVTSFGFVERRMRTESWKRLQRWAYVFFGLVYVHLLLMLLPSALHGGLAAQASVAVYSVVFVGYALCRVGRALADKRAEDAVSASNDLTPAISDEPEAHRITSRSARLSLGAPCAREGSDGRDEKFHGEARANLAGIAVHGLGSSAGFGLYSQLGNGMAV